MRALYTRKHAQLRELEREETDMPAGPRLTLEMGIELTGRLIDWCETAERRLADGVENQIETETKTEV
jgi:Virulence activator alpha C-term